MSNMPPGSNLNNDPGQHDPPSDVWIVTDATGRHVYPFNRYAYEALSEHGEENITVGTWDL